MADDAEKSNFLSETISQLSHVQETLKRRRALLEKESRKLPAMRFGSARSSPTTRSPQPPVGTLAANRSASARDRSHVASSVSPVPRTLTQSRCSSVFERLAARSRAASPRSATATLAPSPATAVASRPPSASRFASRSFSKRRSIGQSARRLSASRGSASAATEESTAGRPAARRIPKAASQPPSVRGVTRGTSVSPQPPTAAGVESQPTTDGRRFVSKSLRTTPATSAHGSRFPSPAPTGIAATRKRSRSASISPGATRGQVRVPAGAAQGSRGVAAVGEERTKPEGEPHQAVRPAVPLSPSLGSKPVSPVAAVQQQWAYGHSATSQSPPPTLALPSIDTEKTHLRITRASAHSRAADDDYTDINRYGNGEEEGPLGPSAAESEPSRARSSFTRAAAPSRSGPRGGASVEPRRGGTSPENYALTNHRATGEGGVPAPGEELEFTARSSATRSPTTQMWPQDAALVRDIDVEASASTCMSLSQPRKRLSHTPPPDPVHESSLSFVQQSGDGNGGVEAAAPDSITVPCDIAPERTRQSVCLSPPAQGATWAPNAPSSLSPPPTLEKLEQSVKSTLAKHCSQSSLDPPLRSKARSPPSTSHQRVTSPAAVHPAAWEGEHGKQPWSTTSHSPAPVVVATSEAAAHKRKVMQNRSHCPPRCDASPSVNAAEGQPAPPNTTASPGHRDAMQPHPAASQSPRPPLVHLPSHGDATGAAEEQLLVANSPTSPRRSELIVFDTPVAKQEKIGMHMPEQQSQPPPEPPRGPLTNEVESAVLPILQGTACSSQNTSYGPPAVLLSPAPPEVQIKPVGDEEYDDDDFSPIPSRPAPPPVLHIDGQAAPENARQHGNPKSALVFSETPPPRGPSLPYPPLSVPPAMPAVTVNQVPKRLREPSFTGVEDVIGSDGDANCVTGSSCMEPSEVLAQGRETVNKRISRSCGKSSEPGSAKKHGAALLPAHRAASQRGRRSELQRLLDACPRDMREEVEQAVLSTPAGSQVSEQRSPSSMGRPSDALTDDSTISQRVAARSERSGLDFRGWERHAAAAAQSTPKSAKKAMRESLKVAASANVAALGSAVKRRAGRTSDVLVETSQTPLSQQQQRQRAVTPLSAHSGNSEVSSRSGEGSSVIDSTPETGSVASSQQRGLRAAKDSLQLAQRALFRSTPTPKGAKSLWKAAPRAPTPVSTKPAAVLKRGNGTSQQGSKRKNQR